MHNLPLAGTGTPDNINKLKRVVQTRGLVGAANDTKWNELIAFARGLEGWRPSYRTKWIDGHISGWDAEWFYHLPLPFIGVEWLDISLIEQVHRGKLVAPEVIDHSTEILAVIKKIGFESEVRREIVRIWGYLPKTFEDFPPSDA
jgi:hypothetical protein